MISREELKSRMDRGDDIKLAFVLNEWAFRAQHIPGSIHVPDEQRAGEQLSVDDEIVVYCAGISCQASAMAYKMLQGLGFMNVHRYAGGLADWFEAGYRLEGELVSTSGT